METKATFAIAEVKSAPSENPNGEFEIIMSTDSVDRDGEVITKGAFDPLPDSLPVHAFHNFDDPIGRAVPTYDDSGRLIGRGYFAATPRAQEIRQLVADGVIGHTSVGFMAAERKSATDDDPVQIKSAELLEVSFVSVPSNRDAAVLLVKSAQTKVGARNSGKDSERLQAIHDYAVENGAECATKGAHPQAATPAPETPGVQPGKSPASEDVVAAYARLRAEAARLVLPT